MIKNSPAAWSERAAIGKPHKAALWSREGQQTRMRNVLDALKPQPGETLLDYGCGTGTLSGLVAESVSYIGYDWAAGMVERAYRDHPERYFRQTWPTWTCDLVACVGPFNLRDGWSKRRTWETLARLWNQTGRALAVCLYAGDDPDCLNYRDDELIAFSSALEADTLIRRHRKNDWLMVLER